MKTAKDKKRESDRRYHQEHKDEIRANTRKWRAANREHYLKYQREWYRKNRELQHKQQKRWRQNNKHIVLKAIGVRGRKIAQATPDWADMDKIAAVYRKRDELNEAWRLTGQDSFVVDHIIPIDPRDQSVCGLHCWENLQLLSRHSNGQKQDRYEADW